MNRTAHVKRSLLKSAVSFHGHLGPYLVLGLRMGLVAVEALKPHELCELSATIWTRRSPPESCLLDGIQVSCGCTLGRGNLGIRNTRKIRARFRKGNRTVLMRPTRDTAKLLLTVSRHTPQERLQKLAFFLNSKPNRDLLVLKPGK
jgi:formylmethanofuran dehydrogenase subunit E